MTHLVLLRKSQRSSFGHLPVLPGLRGAIGARFRDEALGRGRWGRRDGCHTKVDWAAAIVRSSRKTLACTIRSGGCQAEGCSGLRRICAIAFFTRDGEN